MRAAAALALALVLVATGCGSAARGPTSDSKLGRTLIEHYGCGACHEIGGVDGATGHVGPPLKHFRDKRRIAGKLPNTRANAARWVQHPDRIKPQADMPNLGLTPGEANDIVAYLETQ